MKKRTNGFGIHSMNVKITAYLLIFVLFSLILFGVFLSLEFRKVLVREAQTSMENSLENLSYNMELMLSPVEMHTTALSLNSDILEFVSSSQDPHSFQYLQINRDAKELLKSSMYSHNILKSIYLVSVKESSFLRTDIERSYTPDEILQQDWFQALSGIELNQYQYFEADMLTEQNREAFLSYIVPIRNHMNHQVIGYLMSNIGYNTIAAYFGSNTIGENGEIFVYGRNGLIYSSEGNSDSISLPEDLHVAELYTEKQSGTITSDGYLYTFKWCKSIDWLFVAKIPMQDVLQPSVRISRWSVLMFVFAIPFVLIASILLSNLILSPVNTLLMAMDNAGEGNHTHIQETRKDEFGEAFRTFNTTVDKLFLLMEKLARQEALTKELRIKNLQAQLSPHFLYNTLDSIHWAARDNDMEAVCQMTFLLSDYFRKNLSDGKEWVSVQEVAEMIQSYLRIQSLRFMGGFTYNVLIDPAVRYLMVPKDVFQPIVENALYHGIERSDQEGYCIVCWESFENHIRFSVNDNGHGMSADELLALHNSLDQPTDTGKSFALRNIQQQLKLYFKQSIHIESTLDEGTQVWFLLDKNGGEKRV